ncbi:MAG: hypothetical protein K9L78_05230 [Victivallales bacterium]|nr:hypothetical protein [Victivallales bacterium]MCF7889504.1 hypothetical protein [Victivallales bacterium]
MYLKNKTILLVLIFFYAFCIKFYAGSLKINFLNSTSHPATVSYIDSNTVEKFKNLKIPAGNSIKKNFDFSDDFYLNLKITSGSKPESKTDTELQIVHNYNYKLKLKNYIPSSGPLSGFGCAWENTDKIKINKIFGTNRRLIKYLPIFNDYMGNIEIEIADKASQAPSRNALEFTLFALPVSKKLKDIKLNTTEITEKKLNKNDFKLSRWGIQHKSKLSPSVHFYNSTYSRWVDLIIHNFTVCNYIYYALKNKPEDERVKLHYQETVKGLNVSFFPPQTQLRGPSFKFKVLQDNKKLIPVKHKKAEQDKIFLLIGAEINSSTNTLEYIPLQIISDLRIGSSLKKGINVSGYKNHVYNTKFYPVNVSFNLNSGANFENLKKIIRVPLRKFEHKFFDKLSIMKNIRVEHLPQSDKQETPKFNKTGARFHVSAVSETGNKYYYKIILVAPPFLTGNTPGIFKPGRDIPAKFSIGNYQRYPLHIYIMPSDRNGCETQLTGRKISSDLPENMIGSIEYFISDTVNSSDL